MKTQSPNHLTARAALCSMMVLKSCSVSEGFTLSKSPNFALPQFGKILSKLMCPVPSKIKYILSIKVKLQFAVDVAKKLQKDNVYRNSKSHYLLSCW